MKPEDTVGKFVTCSIDGGAVWAKICNFYVLNNEVWLIADKLIIENGGNPTKFSSGERSLNFKSLLENKANFFFLTSDVLEELENVEYLNFLGGEVDAGMRLGLEEMKKEST